MRSAHRFLILASAALLAGTAGAAEPYSGIDPNTFILGHPASPRWKLVHTNQEHPAVLVARRAREQEASRLSAVDPNLFIVQPPASVHWLATTQPAQQVAAVHR